MRFSKINNHPEFVKDHLTGAIVNINTIKAQGDKRRLKHEQQKNAEIEQLKSDVSDIKQMLSKLLELSKNG